MRCVICLALACLVPGIALGQAAEQSIFDSVKPEATIRVVKHAIGADLVTITLLDPAYPADALRSQIARLGQYLHSDPRGVFVFALSMRPNDPGGAFLRGTFAVDGLADATTGRYRLGPLCRAMAGGPKGHEIHGMAIIFEGLKPGPQTIKSWGLKPGSPVSVEGRYYPGPIGLEYRVALHDQDPAKVDVPDTPQPEPPVVVIPPPPPPSNPYILYGLLIVGAVAAGALVYSVTLKGPRRGSIKASRNSTAGTYRNR